MVPEPSAYQWSSYRHNALGEKDGLITPHVVYQSLGNSRGKRQRAYRDLFSTHLDGDITQRIETALEHNHVLGTDRFRGEIEKMLRRRIGTGRPGRPPKPKEKTPTPEDAPLSVWRTNAKVRLI